MRYKNFNQYISQYSNNEKDYLNKVGIASSSSENYSYYANINNQFDLKESDVNIPIIMSSDYSNDSNSIYESDMFKYNRNTSPDTDSVFEDFSGCEFIPKTVNSIPDTKKLKFPIKAVGPNSSQVFKTIGKLRSSEGIYSKFTEKITPKTRYTALSFKGKPISVVETVNKFPMDVDINRFKHLSKIRKISEMICEKYDLDVYNIELIESVKGSIYVNGVNTNLSLNPHQAYLVYESVYQDHYDTKIPNWVRRKIIEENVSGYYKQKSYDSMLVKTNNTMDYNNPY